MDQRKCQIHSPSRSTAWCCISQYFMLYFNCQSDWTFYLPHGAALSPSQALPPPKDASKPADGLSWPLPSDRHVSLPRDCPDTPVGAPRRPPWSVAIATCPTAEGSAPVPDAPRSPFAVDWLSRKLARGRGRPWTTIWNKRCRVRQMAVQRVRTAFVRVS